jgi:3-hydroxybutyryl-CoA dehydrogenase
MTGLVSQTTVGVVGTGTRGQGIAQVALMAGHPVRLYDALPGRAQLAAEAITARLDRLVAKDRLDVAGRDAALARLGPVQGPGALAGCGLVIEAVLEELDVKRALFGELEEIVDEDCLLATNTSSLSVTAIAGALRHPERVVGLHFFNPAPLLPLVEVVSRAGGDAACTTRAYDTMRAWGKVPVRCSDTPGFIVNRIARPFYAEGLRLYEENAADPATIDAVLRESGGFRMGPFELTDLIGQDVNEAVTRSVWESFFHDAKFTPSAAQRRLVQSGRLGRKSGQGWYEYGETAPPAQPATAPSCPAPGSVGVHGVFEGPLATVVAMLREAGVILTAGQAPRAPEPCITLPGGTRLTLTDGAMATGDVGGPCIRLDLALDYRTCARVALAPGEDADSGDVRAAIGLFQRLGKKVSVIADTPGMIVARTVAMLIDFALDAEERGVGSGEDIDTAMRLGVNYPRGPLEWCEAVGVPWVCTVLGHLHGAYPSGRYGACLPLKRRSSLAYRQGF